MQDRLATPCNRAKRASHDAGLLLPYGQAEDLDRRPPEAPVKLLLGKSERPMLGELDDGVSAVVRGEHQPIRAESLDPAPPRVTRRPARVEVCLLYTSDAADDL